MLSAKGEAITVVAIIAILLGLSILSWFPSPETKDYVRTALSVIFCWFLFDGRAWAKWLIGILSGLAGLAAFVALFWFPLPEEALMVFLILGMTYICISFVLLSPVFIAGHLNKR